MKITHYVAQVAKNPRFNYIELRTKTRLYRVKRRDNYNIVSIHKLDGTIIKDWHAMSAEKICEIPFNSRELVYHSDARFTYLMVHAYLIVKRHHPLDQVSDDISHLFDVEVKKVDNSACIYHNNKLMLTIVNNSDGRFYIVMPDKSADYS